jgi:hypothetical protein
MNEKLNTSNEILAVANVIRLRDRPPFTSLKVMGKRVDEFDVYLPKYLDELAAQYGIWLLENPYPGVNLHFTRSDIIQEK